MTEILLDAGPIISLTTNSLLWLLDAMQKKANVRFSIVSSVKHELVDRPLETKKFKFEALQVQRLIEQGTLKVIDTPELKSRALQLLEAANTVFWAHKEPIRIVQIGEMETLAAAVSLGINRVVMDERITRSLLETPDQLEEMMSRRLHRKVHVDTGRLDAFRDYTHHIELIRSAELVTVAYEKGLLDSYVVKVPNAKKELLESVLWGVKLNGCSISEDEINELVKAELGS
ncbi:MAG: hypothetical protein QXM31_02270 [Candidatus Woesearchaeota archaeon]